MAASFAFDVLFLSYLALKFSVILFKHLNLPQPKTGFSRRKRYILYIAF